MHVEHICRAVCMYVMSLWCCGNMWCVWFLQFAFFVQLVFVGCVSVVLFVLVVLGLGVFVVSFLSGFVICCWFLCG